MRKLMISIVIAATSIGICSSALLNESNTTYLGLVDLDCVRVDFQSNEEGPGADAMPAALRDFVRTKLPGLAIRDDCPNYLDLSFLQPGRECQNLNLSVSRPVLIVGAEHPEPIVTVVWSKGYTSTGGASKSVGSILVMFRDDYLRANKP